MRRMLLALGVIALVAGLGNSGVAQAAPTPAVSLSPAQLTINDAATPGGSTGLVTVRTGKKSVVYQTPASFTHAAFNDTAGGGSCYSQYLSLGHAIPAQATCTIEVFFQAGQVGTVWATMTVQVCKTWQFSAAQFTCRSVSSTASTTVVGIVDDVDLEVTSVQVGSPTGVTPYGFTATVRNNGTDSVGLTDVGVQGYYSADQVLSGTDGAACGRQAGTALLEPGDSVSVPVGCSGGPSATDEYLLVIVDISGVVLESNETNNMRSQTLGSPGVDLVVSRIAFVNGSSGDYTVTIANVGRDTADNPGLKLQGYYSADQVIDAYDDGPGCGLEVSSPTTIAGLSSINVVVGCSAAPRSGDNYLLVDMDLDNDVVETNDANNVGVLTLS